MSDIDFSNTRLLIADSGKQNRTEIRNILFHEGFRDITDSDNYEFVREQVAENNVDLLIVDYEFPKGDVCKLIKEIRHDDIGNNPFVVIIALAFDPEKEDIMRIIDSGSDDVLLKPISAGSVVKRIKFFANERKKFVVTSDYIGPTRRSSHRPGTVEIPEIDVPNPVRITAVDGKEMSNVQDEVQHHSNVLNEQKVERQAHQIIYLVERIMPLYFDGNAVMDVTEDLDDLKAATGHINLLKDTKYEYVGELCETLMTIVDMICLSPNEPDSQSLKLLPELSQSIVAALQASGDESDIAHMISDSVQRQKH